MLKIEVTDKPAAVTKKKDGKLIPPLFQLITDLSAVALVKADH